MTSEQSQIYFTKEGTEAQRTGSKEQFNFWHHRIRTPYSTFLFSEFLSVHSTALTDFAAASSELFCKLDVVSHLLPCIDINLLWGVKEESQPHAAPWEETVPRVVQPRTPSSSSIKSCQNVIKGQLPRFSEFLVKDQYFPNLALPPWTLLQEEQMDYSRHKAMFLTSIKPTVTKML